MATGATTIAVDLDIGDGHVLLDALSALDDLYDHPFGAEDERTDHPRDGVKALAKRVRDAMLRAGEWGG